ncbi:unnamed protein product [Protopolystoma xenopodis]|uniref:Uncharacterized protein n=1 Tax=Protopolystoma xenopodis TaxID=117903 RepID=A0A448WXW1_9PLAT|nr:unnamed protein product [Protopolystoma xenopodis]
MSALTKLAEPRRLRQSGAARGLAGPRGPTSGPGWLLTFAEQACQFVWFVWFVWFGWASDYFESRNRSIKLSPNKANHAQSLSTPSSTFYPCPASFSCLHDCASVRMYTSRFLGLWTCQSASMVWYGRTMGPKRRKMAPTKTAV